MNGEALALGLSITGWFKELLALFSLVILKGCQFSLKAYSVGTTGSGYRSAKQSLLTANIPLRVLVERFLNSTKGLYAVSTHLFDTKSAFPK
jgi:hypothetical protein